MLAVSASLGSELVFFYALPPLHPLALFAPFRTGESGRFPKAPISLNMDSEDSQYEYLNGKRFKDLDPIEQTDYNGFQIPVSSIPKDTDVDTGQHPQ